MSRFSRRKTEKQVAQSPVAQTVFIDVRESRSRRAGKGGTAHQMLL